MNGPLAKPHRFQIIDTPTGPLTVITPVAERLLKDGVISGTLDGPLHAADAATVKAAMIGHAVCDFCSAPGATHGVMVPDFDMALGMTSTGGWAACDDCHPLILRRRKKDLLDRSVANLSFPKFSKQAIADLHQRFWAGYEATEQAVGLASRLREFVDDTIPAELQLGLAPKNSRAMRLKTLMSVTGLSAAEIDTFVAPGSDLTQVPPAVLAKLETWRKRVGTLDAETFGNLLMGIQKPAAPHQTPHWQQALDAKFEAAALLRRLLTSREASEFFPDAVDLNDQAAVKRMVKMAEVRQSLRSLGFERDLKLLPGAQAYSFNGETAAAIQEAATGIPHDAPLSSIETPNTGSGWFWFSDPLAVAASPAASDHTNGLLWAWTNVPLPSKTYPAGTDQSVVDEALRHGPSAPALMFSAYVQDTKGRKSGQILPSTRWFWPFHMTFHEMLGFNTATWRQNYGPGSALEHDPNIISEKATIKVIADLSLFFVMACLWFRQTVPGQPKKKVDPVLTQEPGHIERHARKRFVREHKLSAVPTVTVVALRKSARVAAEPSEGPVVPGARQYHVRWIVKGHPRMQACGPGRADRKLIWIESHPAGPEDKPLRTKTTVFAVVR